MILLIPCNLRTGKAHYLVICTCPDTGTLGRIENQPMHAHSNNPIFAEGPIAQTGAPYARVPGIRVYGMLCLVSGGKKRRRKSRVLFSDTSAAPAPAFPPVPEQLWDSV